MADLEALDEKWPVSQSDKTVLATIRSSVSAFVGSGIETAVRQELLGQLATLAHPEGMSDPLSFVDDLDGLSADDTAKVMGGNLSRLMNVA